MLFLFLAVGLQSCTKDDEPIEVITDDSTFANFADLSNNYLIFKELFLSILLMV